MKKTLALASACLLAVTPLAGPGKGPLSPDETITEIVRTLRHDDLQGLMEVTAGEVMVADLSRQWELQRTKQPSERDRREFAKAIAFVTAPGAEERIMELVRPKLDEMRPQWKMTSSMIIGMAQSTLEMDPNLDPVEKEQARKLVGALAQVVQTTDFMDEELAEKAVAIFCRAARRMNLKSIDDVQAIDFAQLMGKGGMVYGSLKEILQVYGMDVNGFLDSVRAETVYEAGDKAKVKVSYVVLGQRLNTEAELVRVEGRWMAKDSVEKAANLMPMGH